MTTLHLRKDLGTLAAYRPGRGAGPDEGAMFKLSSNENPYPPLPSVAGSIADLITTVNRYPETAGHAITARICERFDVEPAAVVLGSGSVEIISQLMRATAGPGDEIVIPWRSFEAYPLLALGAGALPVEVPLTTPGLRHDFTAMRAAITARTRLIVVCNPNNPTGTTVGSQELTEFINSVPPEIVVLIDEAYLQFNRDVEAAQGIDFLRRYPNVVVAHTFSKAYGLAGLRIGYALAPERVAAAMRTVAVPFAVTNLAQVAAIASFDAESELLERVDSLVAERARLAAALAAQGWELPPTQANFFWFPLGARTDEAVDVFARHRVLVRPFSGEGLRVCLGDHAANEALLAAAAELRSQPVSGS